MARIALIILMVAVLLLSAGCPFLPPLPPFPWSSPTPTWTAPPTNGVTPTPTAAVTAKQYADLALELIKQKKYDEAVAQCNQAIALDPNYYWSYSVRADAYRYSDRNDQAVKDYTKAIELASRPLDFGFRALAYLKTRQYNLALADARKAVTLDPKDAYLWAIEARVLVAMDRLQEAAAAYQTAILLDPTEEAATDGLADLLAGKAEEQLDYIGSDLTIVTKDLPAWPEGAQGTVDLKATGGTGKVIWAGMPPLPWTLDSRGGISGTAPPVATGTEQAYPPFTATVIDEAGHARSAAFIIKVTKTGLAVTPRPPGTYTPTPTMTPGITPSPTPSATISRHYAWSYKGSSYTWDLNLLESLYLEYKARERTATRNYSVYVTHPRDDTYITNLANKLSEAAQKKGLGQVETAQFVANFVQSLPYTFDNVSTAFDEYPRYPVETLVDNGGDCEDTAILAAALLRAMGYDVVLLGLPKHMALAIRFDSGVSGTYYTYEGSKYYYLETTGEGWAVGQIPPEYKDASASIYPMIPVAIVHTDWKFSWRGTTGTITINVKNIGTAALSQFYVTAAFDAGNNMVWNKVKSDTVDLAPDGSATFTLNYNVPTGKHTRMIVQVIDSNKNISLDTTYSDWFNT